MANLSVSPILDFAIKKWASDIHITEGSFIVLRVNWKLLSLESTWKLEKIKVNQILLELLWEQKDLIKEFLTKKDLDFSYLSQLWTTFRVNAFFKLWKISLVMRKIETNVKTLDELMLPEWAKEITELKNWLVIISWPAWSWKSTTITTLLEEINKTRGEHIVTIEDPVEFVFSNKKSIFSQRNVGRDTDSINSALRSAFREDSNIVMIWEIRDAKTFNLAMDMAESWILVITSISASSTWDTLKKIFWFYNNDEQITIYNRLASILKATLFQKLVVNKNNDWRVAVFEVMKVNDNIELLLKSWKTNELANLIHVSWKDNMISLTRYADRLVEKWLITQEFKELKFPIE